MREVCALPREIELEKHFSELSRCLEGMEELSLKADLDLLEEIQRLNAKVQRVRAEKYRTLSPWERVQISRHPDRPVTTDYISRLFDDWTELHGDRLYADDMAIVAGIASFSGLPVTVVGHEKGKDTPEKVRRNFGMPHPEGYRKVERLLKQAEKFGRPVISFIDTQGAYPGTGAEERGQAYAISRLLMRQSTLTVPTLAFITGEGGSGGALALAVADRMLMLSNAVFSVASPEAAASILMKDQHYAEQISAALKLTADDIMALGIIDEIIEEPIGGAHLDCDAAAAALGEAIGRHLDELMAMAPEERCQRRYERLRCIGPYHYECGLPGSSMNTDHAEEKAE